MIIFLNNMKVTSSESTKSSILRQSFHSYFMRYIKQVEQKFPILERTNLSNIH